MGLIFILSAMEHPPVPRGIPDTAYHVPEYFVLALLLFVSLRNGRRRVLRVQHVEVERVEPLQVVAQEEQPRSPSRRGRCRAIVQAVSLSIFYGASDELHQAFVPGRFSELRDVISDAVGALLAASVVLVAGWLRGRHPA